MEHVILGYQHEMQQVQADKMKGVQLNSSKRNSLPRRHSSNLRLSPGLFSSPTSCCNLDNLQNHPSELPT